MKVTKEQKIFIGLLVVGLVALGVDRFMLTPSSAEASEDASTLLVAKPQAAKPTPPPNAKSAVAATANPVAQKLLALSESLHIANTPVKDTFATPVAWTDKPGTVAGGKRFDQAHSLSGVMVSGRHPAAMIDGKLVSVGQTIDGYKLVAVAQGTAVFQFGDTTVTLHSR